MTEPLESRSVQIVAIAAVARNGVIGAAGDIPWRIAEDWARFKRLTLGHVLVMGRRTFDSIGRPLPGRTTFVITRDTGWQHPGVEVFTDPDRALDRAITTELENGSLSTSGPTVFVAGGAEIYRAVWPRTTALEITEVDQEPDGDVRFPEIDRGEWQQVSREAGSGFAFVGYRRTSPGTPRESR